MVNEQGRRPASRRDIDSTAAHRDVFRRIAQGRAPPAAISGTPAAMQLLWGESVKVAPDSDRRHQCDPAANDSPTRPTSRRFRRSWIGRIWRGSPLFYLD